MLNLLVHHVTNRLLKVKYSFSTFATVRYISFVSPLDHQSRKDQEVSRWTAL